MELCRERVNNYIWAQDANIATFDALAVVNDTFTADQICNGIAGALPSNFNGTVWFQVKDAQGLWSLDVDSRIPYLENLTKTCQQHGLKPGFYSTAYAWQAVFGSQGAGSKTLSATPVWYYNDNVIQNFDDFRYAGFGTWDEPTMKNYARNGFLCSLSFSSYEYYEN